MSKAYGPVLLMVALLGGCAVARTPLDGPSEEVGAAQASLEGFEPVPAYSVTLSPSGEAEREVLARLENEIGWMQGLVGEAEAQASPNARIRFRYDWLRQDLETVRAGIRAHLRDPGEEPRRFPPLRGDYRR